MPRKTYFSPQDERLINAIEQHRVRNFLPSSNAAINHALSSFFFGGAANPAPISSPPVAAPPIAPPAPPAPSGVSLDGWT
jgi:hypothetical protein